MAFTPHELLAIALEVEDQDLASASMNNATRNQSSAPSRLAPLTPVSALYTNGSQPRLSMPSNHRVAELVDGLANIERALSELKEQESALEAKRSTLEAEIIAVGQATRSSIFEGRTARAALKTDVIVALPTKERDPDGYHQLDGELRSSGEWLSVSSLDRYALQRIWKGQQRDPGAIRQLLKPYIDTRTQTKVKLISVD